MPRTDHHRPQQVFGSGASTNSFNDLAIADCVFIIGSNNFEAHPLAGRRIMQAKEKGAHITICDPHATPTAKQAHPALIPPDFMFQMIRSSHVANSCINCGQCSELCPLDIPNTLYMHAQQLEYQRMFGYKPGYDMTLPSMICNCAEKSESPSTIYSRKAQKQNQSIIIFLFCSALFQWPGSRTKRHAIAALFMP